MGCVYQTPPRPMPSLETIPQDLLEYIAVLSGSAPAFEVPRSILALLLTSRALYDALSFPNCPQLYAKLFQSRLDFDPARKFLDGQGRTD